MKTYEIRLSPAAEDDLRAIYDWISKEAGHRTAEGFIERIEKTYWSLAHFPERGSLYDHIMPGLRIFGMERRITIAFRVDSPHVAIFRILYAGHDLTTALKDDDL